MKNLLSLSRFMLFILFTLSAAFVFGAPGDLDTGFGTGGKVSTMIGATSIANAVAFQADGKIVVAGESGNFPNIVFALARYNSDGSLDAAFDGDGKVITVIGTGGSDRIADIAIQADGKIVAVGGSDNGSNSDFVVVRYNANGSLDTSFDGDGKLVIPIGNNTDEAYGVVIQSDGKIVIAGGSRAEPSNNFALVRLNSDGSFDASFDGDGIVLTPMGAGVDGASDVALQQDGKIVAVGDGIGASLDFAVLRYNANGSLDASFGNNGKVITTLSSGSDFASAVSIQTDGKIVVAGSTPNNGSSDFAVVRYNPNGSLDNSFNGAGIIKTPIGNNTDYANSVTIQANGKIVAGGASFSAASSLDFALVRYNANGSLDASFDGDGKLITAFSSNQDYINSIAVQPNGRIIAVGSNYNGTNSEFAVARYMGDAAQTYRAPFDFDGDSKTDIGIFRPSGGEWWISRSSSNQTTAAQFGASSDRPVPADFTGDGKTDVAFWRASSGQWFILRSEDSSFYAFPFGANGDIPAPADFDGDGKADAAVFRPSNAAWFIQRSSDNQTSIVQFGVAEDRPVAADYDGDGKADIAVFRPSVAQWWILKSSGGIKAVQFGQTGDKTAAGDYTGDGKADIAFWRESNGFWYILRSENDSFYGFQFGSSGDVPVPGDYDGDGKMDAAVFRASNTGWYLQRSSSGFLAVQFGTSGDQPVPNVFVR